MKRLLLLPLLVLACAAETSVTMPAPTQPLPQATETPIPSPTPDTAATHAILEQAALDAQLTNVAFESLHIGATVQAAQLTAQADGWTVTAAMMADEYFKATGTAQQTAVPLTQTAIVDKRNEVAVMAAILSATAEAPTLVIAQARAESEAMFEPVRSAGMAAAPWSLTLAALALVVFVLRRWHLSDMKPQAYGSEIYHLQKVGGADLVHVTPERADQLRHLAQGVFREGKSLAINQWERAGSPFSAAEFGELRNWMMQNKLTVSTGKGELALTPDGESLLRSHLPHSGFITPNGAPPPSTLGETTHIEAGERGAL